MAFIVQARLKEEGDWIPVIDMKLSKTKKQVRLFFTKDEAQYFVNKEMKEFSNENIMIEEVDYETGGTFSV